MRAVSTVVLFGSDFLNQTDGLVERYENIRVVGDVVHGERATFAALEPPLEDLVAAKVKPPHGLRHTAEADDASCGFSDESSGAVCAITHTMSIINAIVCNRRRDRQSVHVESD